MFLQLTANFSSQQIKMTIEPAMASAKNKEVRQYTCTPSYKAVMILIKHCISRPPACKTVLCIQLEQLAQPYNVLMQKTQVEHKLCISSASSGAIMHANVPPPFSIACHERNVNYHSLFWQSNSHKQCNTQ